MTAPAVLLVEDDRDVARPLAARLNREEFEVTVAATVAEARMQFRRRTPDVVLLDLMLPDGDGRVLAEEFRAVSGVPIVMLTAAGDEADRIVGLELGADDYVVKPFSARELVARIRAVLRRGALRESHTAITADGIRLDPRLREVFKDGVHVHLTARQFDLLHLLMDRAGEVVSREEIMEKLWHPDWFGPTHTLDVHISALRKRLEDDPLKPRHLRTIRGVGFRFDPS